MFSGLRAAPETEEMKAMRPPAGLEEAWAVDQGTVAKMVLCPTKVRAGTGWGVGGKGEGEEEKLAATGGRTEQTSLVHTLSCWGCCHRPLKSLAARRSPSFTASVLLCSPPPPLHSPTPVLLRDPTLAHHTTPCTPAHL